MAKRKTHQPEPAEKKLWYKSKAFAPIVLLATFTVGMFTWAFKERADNKVEATKQAEIAEHNRYGNLWEYKDKIPLEMVGKNFDGEGYKYENFLPNLHKEGGKFIVNVYIGEPPLTRTGLILQTIPQHFQQKILNGLNLWNHHFKFNIVKDLSKADLSIYVENNILPTLNISARFLEPVDSPKLMGWANHTQDIKEIGRTILLGGQEMLVYTNSLYFLQNNVSHEFGHQLGFEHPENIFFKEVPRDQLDPYYQKVKSDFPQLSSLSMMISTANPSDIASVLGEFDKKALVITLDLFNEKYGGKHQPAGRAQTTPKPQAQIDGLAKWGEKLAKVQESLKPGKFLMSSTDTLSR